MFKRIAILAAAFLMLIAAGRVNDESNTEMFINRRTGEVRSAAQTPGRGTDESDRDIRESGVYRDRTESASGSLGRRIDPVEVTYDISGIAAEVPEGTEPEEGGTDAAVEEYDLGVLDDGQYAFDGDTMHERADVTTDGGTLAEDCGTAGGAEPEPEGTDPGADADSWADEVEEPAPEPQSEWTYYGNCRITFYCTGPCCCGEWSGGPTASGEEPIPYWTCANGDLPFGTHVLINGVEYCVTDRGVAGDEFDVLVGSHDEALANGMYWTDVYVRY